VRVCVCWGGLRLWVNTGKTGKHAREACGVQSCALCALPVSTTVVPNPTISIKISSRGCMPQDRVRMPGQAGMRGGSRAGTCSHCPGAILYAHTLPVCCNAFMDQPRAYAVSGAPGPGAQSCGSGRCPPQSGAQGQNAARAACTLPAGRHPHTPPPCLLGHHAQEGCCVAPGAPRAAPYGAGSERLEHSLENYIY
jgi:hypothetical protein